MNAEKLSTLRLLKEGMGKKVNVLETRGGDTFHEVRAHLPECSETSMIPILFLITTLAFLEATPLPVPGSDGNYTMPLQTDGAATEFMEIDGWTPADFLSFLRFEKNKLRLSLDFIRGRAVSTEVTFSSSGDLLIETRGRGQSATRWLAYVRGRSHLQEVSN